MCTERTMEISKRCPKCNKDYSKDPYWKSSLKKHLARKNPCDRNPNQEYNRDKPDKSDPRLTKDLYKYLHWLTR